MKRKLRFHEEKFMKLEQRLFEMEKRTKNQNNHRGKNPPQRFEQRVTTAPSKPLTPREQLFQKLQAKGGAGHFYGKDKSRGNGGVRNAMTEPEIKEILKLISLG